MSSDSISVILEQMKNLEKKVDGVTSLLSDPHTGINLRVDRLEQAERSRQRWIGVVMTVSVGGLVTAFWAAIKNNI